VWGLYKNTQRVGQCNRFSTGCPQFQVESRDILKTDIDIVNKVGNLTNSTFRETL